VYCGPTEFKVTSSTVVIPAFGTSGYEGTSDDDGASGDHAPTGVDAKFIFTDTRTSNKKGFTVVLTHNGRELEARRTCQFSEAGKQYFCFAFPCAGLLLCAVEECSTALNRSRPALDTVACCDDLVRSLVASGAARFVFFAPFLNPIVDCGLALFVHRGTGRLCCVTMIETPYDGKQKFAVWECESGKVVHRANLTTTLPVMSLSNAADMVTFASGDFVDVFKLDDDPTGPIFTTAVETCAPRHGRHSVATPACGAAVVASEDGREFVVVAQSLFQCTPETTGKFCQLVVTAFTKETVCTHQFRALANVLDAVLVTPRRKDHVVGFLGSPGSVLCAVLHVGCVSVLGLSVPDAKGTVVTLATFPLLEGHDAERISAVISDHGSTLYIAVTSFGPRVSMYSVNLCTGEVSPSSHRVSMYSSEVPSSKTAFFDASPMNASLSNQYPGNPGDAIMLVSNKTNVIAASLDSLGAAFYHF
jgi:hypothetical protein